MQSKPSPTDHKSAVAERAHVNPKNRGISRFQDLENRIDKPNVESVIKEARDFIKSGPGEIDLIKQKLTKVKGEE